METYAWFCVTTTTFVMCSFKTVTLLLKSQGMWSEVSKYFTQKVKNRSNNENIVCTDPSKLRTKRIILKTEYFFPSPRCSLPQNNHFLSPLIDYPQFLHTFETLSPAVYYIILSAYDEKTTATCIEHHQMNKDQGPEPLFTHLR